VKKRSTHSPVSWFGEDEHGNSFNYIRSSRSGTIAGSLVDVAASQVFQFGTGADGSPTVTITPTDNFPPEGDSMAANDGGEEQPYADSDGRAL
jgi:hypothetical protein